MSVVRHRWFPKQSAEIIFDNCLTLTVYEPYGGIIFDSFMTSIFPDTVGVSYSKVFRREPPE